MNARIRNLSSNFLKPPLIFASINHFLDDINFIETHINDVLIQNSL